MTEKPLLIIGLGNPILGDDGVGWVIANKVLQQYLSNPNVEFDFLSVGGISLMERMVHFEKVIIIDAISSGMSNKGYIHNNTLSNLPVNSRGHTTSSHDTDLRTAIQAGRAMNINLPLEENIHIVGIETGDVFDFSEEISDEVKASIPGVIEIIENLIKKSQI